MVADIVFPKSNEKAFVDMASRLGYSELGFVYKDVEKGKKRIAQLQKKTKIKLFAAGDRKSALVVTKAGFENREIIEKGRTDVLFGLEEPGKKDFAFSRNSGLNQVLCKIAKEKKVMIGFAFSSVLSAKKKSIIIGRMKQNIKLCKKYKVDTVIASFAKDPYEMRSPHDLAAFFMCLGMDASLIKNSFETISLRIKHNAFKKSPNYISEGVSVVDE